MNSATYVNTDKTGFKKLDLSLSLLMVVLEYIVLGGGGGVPTDKYCVQV